MVDDKTGKRLGRVAGARLTELYDGTYGRRIHSFVIDGDQAVPIAHPWPLLGRMGSTWDGWPGELVFVPGTDTPLYRRWRSEFRARPGDPGVPSLVGSSGSDIDMWLTEHPDRLPAERHMQVGRIVDVTMWESTDGSAWSESPAGLPVDARVGHTGSAWWAEGVNEAGDPNGRHWMHLGGEWVSLEEPGDSSDFEPALAAGLGNVTVFTSDPWGGAFDVWVVTHPASY